MYFIVHRFFDRRVATSQLQKVNDEKIPHLGDSEKAQLVTDLVPSQSSKSRSKCGQPVFLIKTLVLVFSFAFTFSFGGSVVNYAALGYNAFLQNIKGHNHVRCSQNVSKDVGKEEPIFIAAPPVNTSPVGARLLDRTGWAATCSSSSDDKAHDCALAIDSEGDLTYWQSGEIKPADKGHWIIINLKNRHNVHSLAMKPSKEPLERGGWVRRHQVEIALEEEKWELVALGTWRNATGEKFATFEPRLAQYVRLTVFDTTQDQGFVAISDINIHAVDAIPCSIDRGGRWGLTLDFPLVPVTAFLNPKNGRLITMAADSPDGFVLNVGRQTISATWNPENGIIEESVIDQTGHGMFCPGTSFDEDGRVVVTGGSTPDAISIYDPVKNSWSIPQYSELQNDGTLKDAKLKIARGYHGQTYLPNGKIFMIGGSWSLSDENKDGEIFDPRTNITKILPNVTADNIRMDVSYSCDPPRDDCVVKGWQQHHPWLFAWKGKSVFHAGPSKKMNWIFTETPNGMIQDGGFRKDKHTHIADGDAVGGITSMYDAEKGLILTAGGAPNYHYWFNGGHRKEATNNAFEIKLGGVNPGDIVEPMQVASMSHKRIFANSVVLPNGETFVVGGQSQGEPFHDETWEQFPEIYSPETKTWREVARHSTPRAYHSWALLLQDATVLVGGGGLSGDQSTNHFDAQIYHPAYLFKSDGKTTADQPKIKSVTYDEKKEKLKVTTDGGVDSASLIRYSALTHSLNNDQRRIVLTLEPESSDHHENTYYAAVHFDDGVALPGAWMLFVSRDGVPSKAETIWYTVARKNTASIKVGTWD